jgi:hypothetical protein
MNARSTFQRDMEITYFREKDKFMVIYLDDITIFSKYDYEHLQHLEKIFQKCRRYGISLNPKKSHFSMLEGKLLGHIIYVWGINIDRETVDSIYKINIPRNKKAIQSFIRKIIFLRCFVLNFREIIGPITNMLKKYVDIKWSHEDRSSFQRINKALIEAHVSVSLDYSNEFMIFSFAFEENIIGVLLQKNDQGHEHPIALFNKEIRKDELKYDILEKHAYSLVKSLKAFRVYILQSNIKSYVSSNSVKEIIFQLGNEGKRGKWIVIILEYELHINPTNMIKG